jgi:putative ABC transport system permease protein
MVSASYFDILGIRPVAGNLFDARDVADSAPAMLIGESVWERVFARDPAAIGRTVLADEQPFTIVGVMPQSFRGLSDNAELWVPFAVHDALVPRNFWDGRGTRWHSAIGRLADGASVETADAALKSVATRLAAAYPSSNATYTAQARTLREVLYGDVRPQLLLRTRRFPTPGGPSRSIG